MIAMLSTPSKSVTELPKGIYQSQQWKATRLIVLRRDGYQCQICGILALGKRAHKKSHRQSPVVDHIVEAKDLPMSQFFDVTNLRVLCKSCDNARHVRNAKTHKPTFGLDGFPLDSKWSNTNENFQTKNTNTS